MQNLKTKQGVRDVFCVIFHIYLLFLFHMKKIFFLFPIILIALASCKKNKCANVSCNGGGSCENGLCVCDSVYEGANCEIEKRVKYFGSYVFEANCDSSNHLDFLSFSKSLTNDGPGKIVIGNLYSMGSTHEGTIFSDGSIYIAPQNLSAGTVSGTASFVNDKIVVRFVYSDDYLTDSCVWVQKDW